ncbi:hypothetical protein [Candidatus Mesenet endosymbiont of Phosphuga atrata]|uniref:hypothetical protein n=1 Tax=Candidatus Mesenet endosymbiont of Phosphuga atrata TaxID=3066221 RepID=UPI0030D5CF22
MLVLLLQPLLRLLQPRAGEPRILGMLKGSIRVVLSTVILTPLIVLIIPVLPFLACFALLNLTFIRDIRHEIVLAIQARMQRFNLVPQTTHDSGVNEDIKSSVENLIREYGPPSNNVNSEIEAYINNSSEFTPDKKQIILKCLKYINQDSVKSSNTDLTLKQVLNLVWQACLDDQNVKDRKNTLVRNLIEIQTTYGKNRAACFTGTFNKIVETLDGIHPLVRIGYYPKEVISAMAPKMIASITKELFDKDAHKEAILQGIGSEAIGQFIESVKQNYREELSNPAYKAFIKSDIDAVLDSAEDLITEELNSIKSQNSTAVSKEITAIAVRLFEKQKKEDRKVILNYYGNENWQNNKIVSTFVKKYAEEIREAFAEHSEIKDFKEYNMDKVYTILQNSLKEVHNSNLEEAKVESDSIQKK